MNSRWLVVPLVAFVRVYQLVVSPWLGPACRFEPSCSQYAIDALERLGPWRGSWLALRRVLRCHPFGGSGFDPVPALPGSPEERGSRGS